MHWCEVLLQTSENCIRNAQKNFSYNNTDRTQTSDSLSLQTWRKLGQRLLCAQVKNREYVDDSF